MQEKTIISNKVNMQLSNLYVVLLVLVLGVVALGSYFIYNTEKDRTITVSGKSFSDVKNEVASFSVTVEANNEVKQDAVDEVSVKSEAIVAALKSFGVPDNDLETINLNVYQREDPVVENGVTVYKPGNWYASYNINIKLRDITKATELTALLTSFDKSSMFGPNFQIDSENIDEATLLRKAIENARIKADAMAKQVGKKVGGVVRISESNAYDNPVAYMSTSEVQKYVIVTYWLK
jgi:uncharacterized protein YggE